MSSHVSSLSETVVDETTTVVLLHAILIVDVNCHTSDTSRLKKYSGD